MAEPTVRIVIALPLDCAEWRDKLPIGTKNAAIVALIRKDIKNELPSSQ